MSRIIKLPYVLLTLGLLLGIAVVFFLGRSDFRYWVVTDTDTYQEYRFDLGDDRDLGFTHRALEHVRKREQLLDRGTPVLADGESMQYVELPEESRATSVERRTWEKDVYDLAWSTESRDMADDEFVMLKNGAPLFTRRMAYGASGPVFDWRIVDGKPAFTLSVVNGNISATDIFYDAMFMAQKYDVKNPRYLFAYDGKIGFVASDQDGDRIFYNGAFITPAFDSVHTQNCCSYTEILPTVYENGVLLFYAKKSDENYIVEVRLPSDL